MGEEVITRTCRICGETHYHFLKHVKNVHGLSPQGYYDQHFKQEGNGHCGYCGTLTKFNPSYLRYERFCSQQCVIQFNHCNHPDWFSQGGKLGMKSRLARDPDCQRKAGLLSGSQGWKDSNLFRKRNGNLNRVETLLWNHPKFQSWNPVKQDRRFLVYHRGESKPGVKGGYILDFSIPSHCLCVEIDHPHSHTLHQDKERDAFLLKQGWKTLRFSNYQVQNDLDLVVETINSYLGGGM